MIITPVFVTRGVYFDRGFTFRKNTIIHCFHGSYSSRGFYFFRYPITIEDYPRQGLVRPAAQRGLGPLNGTPTSIYGMGMMTGGGISIPDKLLLCSCGNQGARRRSPSGARVAQAHSDAGRFRSVYLVAEPIKHYGQLHRPHECGRPDDFWSSPQRTSPLSRGFLGLKQ